jgi:hypothetical protein
MDSMAAHRRTERKFCCEAYDTVTGKALLVTEAAEES